MPHPLRMPAATLITRLKVYDSVAPDGQRGGTPHMHFLCTEMYFVLNGSGAVEIIDHNGFARVDLLPHAALVFSAGTIHRLINPHGDLEILVIMQNSGLPERGDNVVCFAPEHLQDDAAFAAAMRAQTPAEAVQRRDRGVEGFLRLKALFAANIEEGRAALHAFYAAAHARTAHLHAQWREVVAAGAQAEVQATLARLDALAAADTSYLAQAQHQLTHAAPYQTLGFCGHLNRYLDYVPEGVVQG